MKRLYGACLAHPYLTLVLLVCGIYGPVLRGYFFDDMVATVPWAQGATFAELLNLLRGPAAFRWVATAIFWGEVQLFGTWAGGYFMVALAAYSLLVVLVYDCIGRCGALPGHALAAAALFAILPGHYHPATVQTRALDLGWAVLGVWCFTHPAFPPRWWLGVVGAVAIGAGVCSYEQNLGIGAAIYAIVAIATLNGATSQRAWRPIAVRLLPVAVLTGIYAWYRFVQVGNVSFYGDRTVLAQGSGAVLQQYVAALGYAAASQTHLLPSTLFPQWVSVATYAPVFCGAALCLLPLSPNRPRPQRGTALVLFLWWCGTLVPVMDGMTSVQADSRHLFYAGWPLVTAFALYAAPPTRRTSVLGWTVVLLGTLAAAGGQAYRWWHIHSHSKRVVAQFQQHLPAGHEDVRMYLLDGPSSYWGQPTLTPITAAVTLPLTPPERQRYRVSQLLPSPHDPPLHVGSAPPPCEPWPIAIFRWTGQDWKSEAPPAWPQPAPVGAADLHLWPDQGPTRRRGWDLGAFIRPHREQDGERWLRIENEFAFMTGPPLPQSNVPIAYVVLSMAVRAEKARSTADLLFQTATQPTWDGSRVVRFETAADGLLHTYAIPVLAHPRSILDGPITRLGLRPVLETGARVRITNMYAVPLHVCTAPASGR